VTSQEVPLDLIGYNERRMFEYRVTKYDPAFRDSHGAYQREEWTAASDVGRELGGELVTAESYQRGEDAYVISALAFWREAGQPDLIVRGLERTPANLPLSEGSAVPESLLDVVIRRILREDLWCRLESEVCFLHFGWDYCMYVGVARACAAACARAATSGLFVEPFVSPHHPEDGA
jgi:hypothetical protein